jgi:hypothetical protein
MCLAPSYHHLITESITDRNLEEWTDVSERFRDILKIFFSLAITDVFRSVIMIIAVLIQS